MGQEIVLKQLFKAKEKGKISFSEILDVSPLKGDASSRRYFRAQTDRQSYIVCLYPEKMVDSWAYFQALFSEHEIPVPKLYYRDERGHLLEEDLGDITLFEYMNERDSGSELTIYEKVLEKLIAIQSIELTPSLKNRLGTSCFDAKTLFLELQQTNFYFIEKLLGKTIANKRKLEEELWQICRALSRDSMVLNHRDFHSKNIMLQGPEFKIIDFQDARPGIPQYDLVSLLEDCYRGLSRPNVEKLKKYYFRNFVEKHGLQSEQTFYHLYDVMAFQRLFKAVGTFAKIFVEGKNPDYLKYIPKSFNKIKEYLKNWPEFPEISRQFLELNYESS